MKDKNNYPILLFHIGNPSFLTTTIERLRLFNDADIILLGDESNKNIKGVSHYDIKDFFRGAREFEDRYYIHMSSLPYSYEIVNFQRWFVIEEFVKNRDYEKFWYLDSDVLVYGSLNEYINNIKDGKSYDLIGFDTQNCGKGDSFMPAFNCLSPKLIPEITKFFIDSYTNPEIFKILRRKWNKHASQKIPGGITDMIQLRMFFELNEGRFSVYNAYKLSNESIPDGNINSELNYTEDDQKFRMLHGYKYVFVDNYKAYGYLASGEKVRFNSSHFQGRAKRKMHYYTREHYDPDTFINSVKYNLYRLLAPLLKPTKIMVKSFLKK